MMDLSGLYLSRGALLAPDGIPLHFGDTLREYQAVDTGAILLDRRHEGRILITGMGVLSWLDKIATNKLVDIAPMTGKPTVFTNANARILDRVMVYVLETERVLMITEPNRGDAVLNYLRRNIFYQDKITLTDWRPLYHQFALHGQSADAFVMSLIDKNSHSQLTLTNHDYCIHKISLADSQVFALRQKPYIGSSWTFITPVESAIMVWKTLLDTGKDHHIIPSGGLVFNALRIRAGRVGAGRELTPEYIPLELGLWDEVSFNKGCYTGQEIIARMESRNKLARVLMRIALSQFAEAGTPLFHEGKNIGEITSSVIAPDGTIHAMAVVKTSIVGTNVIVTIGTPDGASARLIEYLGVQPRLE